ncbi:hypothetical protein P7E02_11665 [Enterococcus hulanensis]|uniref:hypothetical protein n=1 Tax=Enterococcus hulanensis TaxID=2559929 RepID=UPI00289131AA|nr:hypothetical protein [Enterococcus hulanensis]MDT2660529.1 hypothetical protein [Enterococcus hulanensis]
MKTSFGLLFVTVLLFSGCSTQQAVEEFDHTVESETQYKHFTAEEYQQNQVPMNEFVVINGTIAKTDNPDNTSVKKDDRFILMTDNSKYQIINQSKEKNLEVFDEVVVYGEYYGFIQAHKIEK